MPSLSLDAKAMGLVFSAGMVGLLIGTLIGGNLGDRIGRKPVIVSAVALLGITSLLTVVAASAYTLTIARLATGIALGGALPSLIALISELVPAARRATLLTLTFTGFPLGAMAAALTATGTAAYGWKLLFAVGGIAPLMVLPLVVTMLAETLPAPKERLSVLPVSTVFSHELRRATTLLLLACAITLITFYLLMNWLPIILVGKGISATVAPLASLAFSFGNLFGALCIGYFIDRFGVRRPAVCAYVLLGAAMLALASAEGFDAILAIAFSAGFFAICAQLSVYSVAPAYYTQAIRSTGVAAVLGAGRLGAVFGPLIAGYLLTAHFSGTEVVRLTAICMPIAALLIIGLPRPRTAVTASDDDRKTPISASAECSESPE
jgi:AAHS family 3-hydroxyphenylpropionic acid transporter